MALTYTPDAECFFSGEDPLFQARQVPGVRWTAVTATAPWPALAELDAYRCRLTFRFVTAAAEAELRSLFRYSPDAIRLIPLTAEALASADAADSASRPGCGVDTAVAAPAVAPATPASAAPAPVADSAGPHTPHTPRSTPQREILPVALRRRLGAGPGEGRAATLRACLAADGRSAAQPRLDAALAATLAASDRHRRSQAWLDIEFPPLPTPPRRPPPARRAHRAAPAPAPPRPPNGPAAGEPPEQEVKYGAAPRCRPQAPKNLKVDQAKIDRLMNLIGEMVVAKNTLPYLAVRAENVFDVRDLAREIKAQYAVINRIAEEMQDAIMQVRMMPVSFIFQRFPRLVRDTSNKLGKEVTLVLEGRGDRSRQEHHRVPRRSADPYRAQQSRPRH